MKPHMSYCITIQLIFIFLKNHTQKKTLHANYEVEGNNRRMISK